MTPYAPYPLNLVRDWFHRWRWWVRLVLALILAPWFGHFSYTRWTGKPAERLDSYSLGSAAWDSVLTPPDPAVDRTKDMATAIRSLPPLPMVPIPTTAPAGMTWVPANDQAASLSSLVTGQSVPGVVPPSIPTLLLELHTVGRGDWQPQERYHLQQAIGYIEQPATSLALDRIRSLVGQPYFLNRYITGVGGPTGVGLGDIRKVAELLTARSRYQLAQKHDFVAALRDIDTVLGLAADIERERPCISVLTGLAFRNAGFLEVSLWGQEFDLSTDQRRQVAEMIQRHHVDVDTVARASFETEWQLTRSRLDMIYTRDSGGNGWFVVRRGESGLDWLACENLLSPLFDDRRETLGRLDQIQSSARSKLAAHIKGNFETNQSGESTAPERFPTCPWLPTVVQLARNFQVPQYVHGANAMGAAVITIHAIEAYHHRHGAYPADLSSLVPETLAALPPDPCDPSRGALRYRLSSSDAQSYVLYSVGIDGQDNSGISRPGGPEQADWVFPTRRSGLDSLHEVTHEWILAPAGSQKPPSPQLSPTPNRSTRIRS